MMVRAAALLVAVAAGLWFALLVPFTALAQEDITPPVLVDVQFQPPIIDTRYSAQVVTVTVHVSDDLAGVHQVDIRFRKPGTTQTNYVFWYTSDNEPVVDTYLVGTMIMPRYSARGAWEMYLVQMSDKVGNSVVHTRDGDAVPWPELYNAFTFTVSSVGVDLSHRTYLPSVTD